MGNRKNFRIYLRKKNKFVIRFIAYMCGCSVDKLINSFIEREFIYFSTSDYEIYKKMKGFKSNEKKIEEKGIMFI